MSRDSVAVLYADRDHEQLGEHYTRHVAAMTAEGLYAKSDIAAELAWRDAEIERLTREAAPQASGGDGYEWADLPWRAATGWLRSASGSKIAEAGIRGGLTQQESELIATAVNAYTRIRRLATPDSAIQSQQGATGGAVDAVGYLTPGDLSDIQNGQGYVLLFTPAAASPHDVPLYLSSGALRTEIQRRYDEMIAADYDKSERVDAIMETLRSLLDWSNSQAAGSAPGEAMPDPLCVQRRSDCRYPKCECPPSAGSVASPAGDDYLPEVLVRLQEAVADRVGSTVMLSKADACAIGNALLRMIATPAAGAGSAPVGVDADTARLDALRDNSWDLCCFDMCGGEDIGWTVFEHHQADPIKREVSIVFKDDPRAAIDAALEKERAE